METKNYFIYNLNTGKFYSGLDNKTAEYTEEKENAKIISEEYLGKELIELRLLGELVEHREVF